MLVGMQMHTSSYCSAISMRVEWVWSCVAVGVCQPAHTMLHVSVVSPTMLVLLRVGAVHLSLI